MVDLMVFDVVFAFFWMDSMGFHGGLMGSNGIQWDLPSGNE